MKIHGMQLLKRAEQKGNEAEVPMTENLGLVQFFKLTFKEVGEDYVMAFAGNCVRHDLLLRPGRRAEVALDKPRLHLGLCLLAGVLAPLLVLREQLQLLQRDLRIAWPARLPSCSTSTTPRSSC